MKYPFTFILAILLIITCVFGTPKEREGKKIVYVDVTCDLFHSGHVNFFRQARAFGDYLIVGILPDEEVMTYKRRPVMNLHERAAAVRGCKYVDEVLEGVPLRRDKEWLIENNITAVVHGDDFNPELCSDQYDAAIQLGIFRLIPYTEGVSTSDLIKRIVDRVEVGFNPQVTPK